MSRTLTLLRFFLSSHGKSDLPVAALLIPTALSAVFALLLRSEVTPFAYAVCTLTLSGALVAIPLLGELGYLLRADSAAEWIEAQPLRPRELRAARALHLLVTLLFLTAVPLAPVAALAPEGLGLLARLGLLVAGLGLAAALAAALLTIQVVLGGRAEGVFVALQTLVVAGVMLGLVLGLRHVATIADVGALDTDSALAFLPTAWFAAPFGDDPRPLPAVAASALALVVLLFLPRPRVPAPRRSSSLAERLLAPARALATRLWVARDERGPFDLVYDAAPREREIVLRSYPMLGIPIAFLLAASIGEGGAERDGLMALLLFTPGIYLPILLSQLPASDSAEARWLQDGAPIPASAWANGAIKAVAVRFLLPLYVLLAALAWQAAGLEFALRMALPGALLSLVVLRRLYAICVPDPPLSVAPDRLQVSLDWSGALLGMAFVLTIGAVLANQFLTTTGALVLAAALVVLELLGNRALRRSPA